jgi:hypothetical protein
MDPRKTIEKQLEEMRRVAELYESMLGTEAWKEYDAYMRQEEENIINVLAGIKEPNAAFAAATALGTIRRMRNYPAVAVATVAAQK